MKWEFLNHKIFPHHEVRKERPESEGVSNNISRSERLSLMTRTSPASEEEAGNFESQNVPDQEVRNEAANEEESDTQMRKAGVSADEDKVEEEGVGAEVIESQDYGMSSHGTEQDADTGVTPGLNDTRSTCQG